LANPGTATIFAGVPVVVEWLQSGLVAERWTSTLPRALRPGEWVDMEVGQGRNLSAQDLRIHVEPKTVGIIDRNSKNDSTTFPAATGSAQ
jgi:hypothetical protein